MYVVETKNTAQSIESLGSSWYMMLMDSALTDEELDTVTYDDLYARAVNTHRINCSVVNNKAQFTFSKHLTPHKGVGVDYDYPTHDNTPVYRVGLADVTGSVSIPDNSRIALLTGGAPVTIQGSSAIVEFTLSKPVPVDYVKYEGPNTVTISAYSGTWHEVGGGQVCTKVRLTLWSGTSMTVDSVQVFTKDAAYVDTGETAIAKAVILPLGTVPNVLGMNFPLIELDVSDWRTTGEVILNGLSAAPGKYVTPMNLSFTINASAEV